MTDQTIGPRRKKAAPARVPVARPARDTLIIDHESFQAMCRSVLNFSEELAAIRRDIADIKLQNYQLGSNQEALSGDIAEIIRRLAIIEQLAQTPAPPPQRYQPPQQFDQRGQPQQRQLPPREPGSPPPPLRDMLRNMQGIPDSQQGFYPGGSDPESGRR